MFDFDLSFLNDMMKDPFNWDKEAYKFNRDEKDMHPYSMTNTKDKVIITHNVLGIDKKDLKISRDELNGNDIIKLEGKTVDEITGKEYSISSTFALDVSQLDLDKITSTMKNGLLYITIAKKEKKLELPKKRIINID